MTHAVLEELYKLLDEYMKTIGDSPWNQDRQDSGHAIKKFLEWLKVKAMESDPD